MSRLFAVFNEGKKIRTKYNTTTITIRRFFFIKPPTRSLQIPNEASKMPINNRFQRSSEDEATVSIDGDGTKDDKLQKTRSQNDRLLRITGLVCVVFATILFVHEGGSQELYGGQVISHIETENSNGVKVRSKGGSIGNAKKEGYELYPFLVDSKAVETPGDVALSKITLPEFPVVSRLEGCALVYKPSNPARTKESEWRKKFWIPSFPGSGASNPTNKGNLLREIIEGLFRGDEGSERGNPVKDYHVSMKKKLKRCKGVSETLGCTSNHPQTPTGPEGQTNDFRPEAIVPIRNPATAIPSYCAYKHIAYQKAKKQAPEEDWRNIRDKYFERIFDEWMKVLKFWRGTTEESSYYFTSVYVPLEDLLTTDASKGAALIQAISDLISGRKAETTKDGYFETSASKEDYECIWYRSAKEEWERQKTIIGDYIPAYTQAQKEKMVSDLNTYADEVEKDPYKGEQDAVLVSILRRYAKQIDVYARVEEAQAPKQ